MKRYLVFASAHYYPSGGWHDFVESFDTREEADVCARTVAGDYVWSHVVDSETGEIYE